MLSNDDRVLIEILRVEKGYCAERLISGISGKKTVNRPLHGTDTTGSAHVKHGVVDVALRVMMRTLNWSQSSYWVKRMCQEHTELCGRSQKKPIFDCRLIGSPLRAFQWAQDEHRTLSLTTPKGAPKRKNSRVRLKIALRLKKFC